ncbi:uncharacterized protein LOC107426400 isoform X2 [Ziziphus jujuba]|uniref:Uncharacterized protein LOC107426400 isoform X2 n=1 Tax=Ziziphus jujuba TaxID=326968 RepID=A0ABM4AI21_ZIZJJ|nr:uncharacterized protein LOC107426400 isoform X2 [Ziziphus jujuba]
MEETEKILQLYDLPFADLLLLSSSSSEELGPLDVVRSDIMEALGPAGPGLLAISGVPNASALRRHLPLARNLALLDADHRKLILKHNLGSDVPLKDPSRKVSSFAMQLSYAYALDHTQLNPEQDLQRSDSDKATESVDNEYKNLGNKLKELGFCMMDLGLRLARVCDRAMGGQELEQSLLESGTAKGRLIHYHSAVDGHFLLKQGARKNRAKQTTRNQRISQGGSGEIRPIRSIHSNLWQQWHYDYGIFTVLTAPLFLKPNCVEGEEEEEEEGFADGGFKEFNGYPSGHTCLQIFDPNKNSVFMVKAPTESFIVQVGESADILSKGKLRATLHSVGRAEENFRNLSRETFVVFLQPAWNKVFSMSDYLKKHIGLELEDQVLSRECSEEKRIAEEEFKKIVPPLWSRLKDGMTFAEFSRETTKQYYGGSGLQSNR